MGHDCRRRGGYHYSTVAGSCAGDTACTDVLAHAAARSRRFRQHTRRGCECETGIEDGCEWCTTVPVNAQSTSVRGAEHRRSVEPSESDAPATADVVLDWGVGSRTTVFRDWTVPSTAITNRYFRCINRRLITCARSTPHLTNVRRPPHHTDSPPQTHHRSSTRSYPVQSI